MHSASEVSPKAIAQFATRAPQFWLVMVYPVWMKGSLLGISIEPPALPSTNAAHSAGPQSSTVLDGLAPAIRAHTGATGLHASDRHCCAAPITFELGTRCGLGSVQRRPPVSCSSPGTRG